MLTCSRYFLGYLWLCLIRAEGIKADSVDNIFARSIFVEDVSESTCVDIGLSDANC